jgi:acetoin utilization protein AcuB
MATAMDIMTTNVISIRPTATVREALKTLDELDVRHLPVVDERSHELLGMLSDRDLLAVRRSDEALRRPVSELMSGDVVSVGPGSDVAEIIELMTENRIGAVPVVDRDAHLAGLVSYVDVLREAAKTLAE